MFDSFFLLFFWETYYLQNKQLTREKWRHFGSVVFNDGDFFAREIDYVNGIYGRKTRNMNAVALHRTKSPNLFRRSRRRFFTSAEIVLICIKLQKPLLIHYINNPRCHTLPRKVRPLTSPNSYCRQLASLKSVTGLERKRTSSNCLRIIFTLIQHR